MISTCDFKNVISKALIKTINIHPENIVEIQQYINILANLYDKSDTKCVGFPIITKMSVVSSIQNNIISELLNFDRYNVPIIGYVDDGRSADKNNNLLHEEYRDIDVYNRLLTVREVDIFNQNKTKNCILVGKTSFFVLKELNTLQTIPSVLFFC